MITFYSLSKKIKRKKEDGKKGEIQIIVNLIGFFVKKGVITKKWFEKIYDLALSLLEQYFRMSNIKLRKVKCRMEKACSFLVSNIMFSCFSDFLSIPLTFLFNF